jgi:hypothetical protein
LVATLANLDAWLKRKMIKDDLGRLVPSHKYNIPSDPLMLYPLLALFYKAYIQNNNAGGEEAILLTLSIAFGGLATYVLYRPRLNCLNWIMLGFSNIMLVLFVSLAAII